MRAAEVVRAVALDLGQPGGAGTGEDGDLVAGTQLGDEGGADVTRGSGDKMRMVRSPSCQPLTSPYNMMSASVITFVAALELFAERGHDQTTVVDVAERAGATERTFFRYFTDKREVLFGAGHLWEHQKEKHSRKGCAALVLDRYPKAPGWRSSDQADVAARASIRPVTRTRPFSDGGSTLKA